LALGGLKLDREEGLSSPLEAELNLDFLLLVLALADPFSESGGFYSGRIGLSFSSLGNGSASTTVPSGSTFYQIESS